MSNMDKSMNKPVFSSPARMDGTYDVVVCGGGPAGVAAAVAAARAGVKVLLVEQAGFLGGAGTNAMVGVWLGSFTRDHKEKVIAGIFQEIVDRLAAENAAVRAEDDVPNSSRHVGYGAIHGATVPFEFEPCKRVLEQLAVEAGVELRYFTTFIAPDIEKGRIKGVFLHGKSGLGYVESKVFVDCTGDADLAYRAGCPTMKGRREDEKMTPATLIFCIEDVDSHIWERYCMETGDVRCRRIIKDLRTKDEWPFDLDAMIFCEKPRRGSFFVNTLLRPDVDGTDEISMTEAIIKERADAAVLMNIIKKYVPGFAKARMTATAPMIGIRETRRIAGEYTLTVADVIEGVHHADTIALTGFGWDLPDPEKSAHQPMFGKSIQLPYIEIPYRVLVVKGISNLITAGRSVSVEREVLGPVRIQPACFATGQAAGTAAALSVEGDVAFSEIDIDVLRRNLVENGAIIASEALLDTDVLAEWDRIHMKETGH